jgi:large subunit ribosomal protein L4
VLVIDAWNFDQPSTKSAVAALGALGLDGRALLVLGEDDTAAWKSFRNLGEQIHPILARELNAYDVLVSDYVVFTRETLPTSEPVTAATPVAAPKARQEEPAEPAEAEPVAESPEDDSEVDENA